MIEKICSFIGLGCIIIYFSILFYKIYQVYKNGKEE